MSEMKTMTVDGKKYDGFVDPIARAQATAFAVINSASGENITISDSSDSNLHGLCIYGKTTQDGTPTPDAPVELVSVGDSGSITVNVAGKNLEHNMTIATPNGLPGIPVTSGGNYTDANGKQWICDEIDFARGVHIRRINIVNFANAVGAREPRASGANYRFSFPFASNPTYLPAEQLTVMCNALTSHSDPIGSNNTNNAVCAYFSGGIYLRCDKYETVGDFLAWAKSIDLTVQYVLTTPIETPLSEEELVAYADLYTSRNNTTVSNDAGAYMELEYVMDAKKYIDSLVASSTIHQATVE